MAAGHHLAKIYPGILDLRYTRRISPAETTYENDSVLAEFLFRNTTKYFMEGNFFEVKRMYIMDPARPERKHGEDDLKGVTILQE